MVKWKGYSGMWHYPQAAGLYWVIPAISLWQMRGNPSLVLTENILKKPPQNQCGLSNWAFRKFPDQQESFSPSGPIFSKWQVQSICHDFDSAWLCHFINWLPRERFFHSVSSIIRAQKDFHLLRSSSQLFRFYPWDCGTRAWDSYRGVSGYGSYMQAGGIVRVIKICH